MSESAENLVSDSLKFKIFSGEHALRPSYEGHVA